MNVDRCGGRKLMHLPVNSGRGKIDEFVFGKYVNHPLYSIKVRIERDILVSLKNNEPLRAKRACETLLAHLDARMKKEKWKRDW